MEVYQYLALRAAVAFQSPNRDGIWANARDRVAKQTGIDFIAVTSTHEHDGGFQDASEILSGPIRLRCRNVVANDDASTTVEAAFTLAANLGDGFHIAYWWQTPDDGTYTFQNEVLRALRTTLIEKPTNPKL